jgi:hypothetical protein
MPIRQFLFLDDIRMPAEVYEYTQQTIFIEEEWVIVRSYKAFVDWIEQYGLPIFISFDHDLADIPDAPQMAFDNEKTGYDCAKWLVNYCLDNHLKCPDYFCHSMNPVGKQNIVGLLQSFQKSQS